ncbi:MAG: hypothetical protein J7L55_05490 [Desulfurococcales archaeon]|nr:hypothetical protein [Desulfurococcales archaeon]
MSVKDKGIDIEGSIFLKAKRTTSAKILRSTIAILISNNEIHLLSDEDGGSNFDTPIKVNVWIKENNKGDEGELLNNTVSVEVKNNKIFGEGGIWDEYKAYIYAWAHISGVTTNMSNNKVSVKVLNNEIYSATELSADTAIFARGHIWVNSLDSSRTIKFENNTVTVVVEGNMVNNSSVETGINASAFLGMKSEADSNLVRLQDNNVSLSVAGNALKQAMIVEGSRMLGTGVWAFTYLGVNYDDPAYIENLDEVLADLRGPNYVSLSIVRNNLTMFDEAIHLPSLESLPRTEHYSIKEVTPDIHFNNFIYDNIGVYAEESNTVPEGYNLTHNWWGNVNGPSGIGHGSGCKVLGDAQASYTPWLNAPYPAGEPLTGVGTSSTVPSGNTLTLSKNDRYGGIWRNVSVTLTNDGESSSRFGLTIFRDGKPAPETPPTNTLYYFDVYVEDGDPTNMQVIVKANYSESYLGGAPEETLKLMWWNGSAWVEFSNCSVDTDHNVVTGYITPNTVPSIRDLRGTVVALVYTPSSAVVGGELEVPTASSDWGLVAAATLTVMAAVIVASRKL